MRIYLDHNATTPVREEVVHAMARVLRDGYGNPSSTHAEGAAARREVEAAREQVASLVGARPSEVIFTAGASEANNTAILALREAGAAARLVTTTVEHPSVEAPAARLEARGHPVDRVAVDEDGRLHPLRLEEALRTPAALASILWANNETGVLQPMAALAEATAAAAVPLHVDATQAVGKIPVRLDRIPVALLSASAHKFGGPKGTGFLVARAGAPFAARTLGGPQERGRRGGTENVAGIVGLGVACELAAAELETRMAEHGRLRDLLWEGIRSKVPRVRRNGSAEHVLPGTLNVEFEETPGEILLEALDLEGVAVSAGAACHSGSIEPSRVLVAMGRSPAQARGSLRFSVGHGVDTAQIERVVALLPDLVARAREAA